MVTKKERFSCPVCGKLIFKQGEAGHKKSKYHLDALAKLDGTKPVISIEPEIKPEIKGIKNTVQEIINDTNKDNKGREDSGASGNNGVNDKWDGYLC